MIPERASWVDNVPGTPFSSTTDQAVQYRESVYALHRLLIDAGWVLISSCGKAGGGSAVASAADNILSANDVVFGTVTTQALSHGAYRAPRAVEADGANFGHPSGGGDYYFMWYADNVNTDVTPNTIKTAISRATYTLPGSPTLNRPTTVGPETTVIAWDICPWTAVVTGRFVTWRNSIGEIIFGGKVTGEGFFRTYLEIASPDGGVGSNRLQFTALSSPTSDVVTSANFATTVWKGYRNDGTILSTQPISTCPLWTFASAWPNGQDELGRIPRMTQRGEVNGSTAAECRYFGRFVDRKGVPPLTPFNTVDDTDVNDTKRWRCIGDTMVPCDRASGAIG
jgi:hypothetical protein